MLKLEISIAKLCLLNLDNVYPVVEKLYSNTGQHAKNQQGIIRSLVLMLAKLVKLAMKDRLPQNHPERAFQQLLARCVVYTSVDMDLLDDTQHFSVAADGTPFYSGGNPRDTKVCDCKSQGIYNCKCPRRYSDIDASWRWDSYREQWYFGDNLFCVVATDSSYDLPIYLRIGHASRHDSVLIIFALCEVRKLYPAIHITELIGNGAMDNYPTYKLLHCFGIAPIIPLDSNAKVKKPDNLHHAFYTLMIKVILFVPVVFLIKIAVIRILKA